MVRRDITRMLLDEFETTIFHLFHYLDRKDEFFFGTRVILLYVFIFPSTFLRSYSDRFIRLQSIGYGFTILITFVGNIPVHHFSIFFFFFSIAQTDFAIPSDVHAILLNLK